MFSLFDVDNNIDIQFCISTFDQVISFFFNAHESLINYDGLANLSKSLRAPSSRQNELIVAMSNL